MAAMEQPWGRLLMAGGTDFATLGRKDKAGGKLNDDARPDLPAPTFIRSVCNIKFKRIIASHSGCHAVALDIDNHAWLFGRNDHHQLTYPLPASVTIPSENVTNETTPAAGEPFLLNSLPDINVPLALKSQEIVEAAVGRSHTILVTKDGEVWTAGWNNLGQCGHVAAKEHVSSFTRVGGFPAGEKVIAAAAGISFSIFLCASGRVYSIGSGEKGQLGTGRTGESIASSKVFYDEQRVPANVTGALRNKKIVQIVAGQQHAAALDEEGYAYSWGFGGLGRLGLGAQYDCLSPVVIPHFSTSTIVTRATRMTAGGTNTMFIDALGMVSLVGKWKTSGDGSSGQPWMSPKLVQDIQGYKWKNIAAGGVTLFASTWDKKEGDFCVGWGQSASCGELGLGEGALKSAVRPTRIEALDGVTLLDLAAGQNSTFFIARPPPTESELAKAATATVAATALTAAITAITPPIVGSGGVDLSGFGFDFAAAPTAKVVLKATISTPASEATVAGVSRTLAEKWEALTRYPDVEEVRDDCAICEKAGDEDQEAESDALECEKCERAFHGHCLTPPVIGIPEGEWFCPTCSASGRDIPFTETDALEQTKFAMGLVEQTAAGKKRKADVAISKSKKKKA